MSESEESQDLSAKEAAAEAADKSEHQKQAERAAKAKAAKEERAAAAKAKAEAEAAAKAEAEAEAKADAEARAEAAKAAKAEEEAASKDRAKQVAEAREAVAVALAGVREIETGIAKMNEELKEARAVYLEALEVEKALVGDERGNRALLAKRQAEANAGKKHPIDQMHATAKPTSRIILDQSGKEVGRV